MPQSIFIVHLNVTMHYSTYCLLMCSLCEVTKTHCLKVYRHSRELPHPLQIAVSAISVVNNEIQNFQDELINLSGVMYRKISMYWSTS